MTLPWLPMSSGVEGIPGYTGFKKGIFPFVFCMESATALLAVVKLTSRRKLIRKTIY